MLAAWQRPFRGHELCSFEGRLPAPTPSDAPPTSSPASCARAAPRGRADLCAAAVGGRPRCCIASRCRGAWSPCRAAVGFALVLIAATSAYLDLGARLPAPATALPAGLPERLRAATGAGWAAVLLFANLDSPRTGAAYNPIRSVSSTGRRRFPVVASPTRLWFWSIALLLPPIGARMAGLDAEWLAACSYPRP